jgi:hypothetical protein
VDEFQNFVTPTIAKNLDQARGFGLHLTLANQFPRQILHAGANGVQVYDSVMANARSKVVFSLKGKENLEPLAYSLFMGTLDPDEVKMKLYSTKVMNYIEETRTIRSKSENWSDATGEFTGATDTESAGGAIYDGSEQDARLWNQSSAVSGGTSHISARGGGESESEVPFLRPVFGKELSSIERRDLEEQLFRAMATLFDQKQRHGVARLVGMRAVGMRAPVNIVTPIIEKKPTSKEMADSFLTRVYGKLPFALRSAEANKRIEERQQKIIGGLSHSDAAEPVAVRRKIG